MDEEKSLMLGGFPTRPGHGTEGKPIALQTNFYEVTSVPDYDIQHYDIEFIPEVPIRIQREIFDKMYAENKDAFEGALIAYDGRKNIFVANPLSWTDRDFLFTLGRGSWKIVIKKVGVASMDALKDFCQGKTNERPMSSIQALDIVLKQNPGKNLFNVGRSYFSGAKPYTIDGGAEVWIGYQQSLRPAQNKLLLNVDIAATAMVAQQPLARLCNSAIRGSLEEMAKRKSTVSNSDIIAINRAIKKINVEMTHSDSKRQWIVNGLSKETAVTKTFTKEDGSVLTVADYFKARYGLELTYPNMPLVHVGPKKKDILVPIEVCNVVKGQRLTKKLSPMQTADMIKITAQKPNVRMASITEGVDLLIRDDDPYAKEFGLKVSKTMMQIKGRVLQPPALDYAPSSREKTINARGGVWQVRNSQYFRAATLERWGILVLDGQKYMPDTMIGAFLGAMAAEAKRVGVEFKEMRPPLKYVDGRRDGSIEQAIKEVYREVEADYGAPPQLLMFVVPRQDSKTYGEIKRVCDTVVDVPSQVLLSKHIKKKNGQYCGNVMLKINVKLGGINSIIQRNKFSSFFMDCPAIIFGADVTHAGPGSSLPSIAALVGSMDAHAYRYATSIRAQVSRAEIIEDLGPMVKELLIGFFRATRKKPEKIMFYRDGVSEGQFAHVRDFEIQSIRQACASLEEGYCPPITFVVVQKRHHARFFASNSRDADRSGNVPAGTCVDSVVCHPSEFDFYLCSHAGLQGTSRPCHYHVLWDENNFTTDMLQNFTYRVSFGLLFMFH